MRKSVVFILFFLAAISLWWCSRNAENKAFDDRKGGSVIIALQGAPENLFPLSIREYDSYEISRHLLNPALTLTDNNGAVQPVLARAWQTDSETATITYFIDPDRRWSDGRPLTAYDVRETFNFIRSNRDKVSPSLRLDIVDSVEVRDSLSVRFYLDRVISDPALITRFPLLPAHKIEGIRWEDLESGFHDNFVGCGPYLLASYTESRVVLKRNPFYDPQVAPDSLIFRFYAEGDTLARWINNREPDLVPDVAHYLLRTVRQNDYYQIEPSVERGFTFLGWNLEHPVLKDRRVRRALSMAIDRQTITDGVMSGYAQVQDVPSYPEFWAYSPLTFFPYDPVRSRAMLDSSNIAVQDDVRRSAGKMLLQPSILVNAENPLRISIAQNIANYWQALGLNAGVEIVPWQQMLQRLRNGTFDVALISWVADDVFNPTELFHSESITTDNNFMRYSSDSVDTYLMNALTHPQRDERRRNWQAFQRKIAQDIPVTVMFNKRQINLVSRRLKDVRINSRGYLINAKEWWLDGRR